MKRSVILTLILITTVTFGQTQPQKIKLRNSTKSMRQELEKYIPIGSGLTDAQQLLQINGFRCTMKQQSSFVEINENKSLNEHRNIDFLICYQRDHLLINSRLWQIAVVHQNGTVSALLNSVDKSPVLHRKDYIHMSDADIRSVLLKYASIGSSEEEVRRVLREVFHRQCKKNTDYTEPFSCATCPKERGGFTLECHMQDYDRLQNFFLAGNYVLSVWYFDKNGQLKDVEVSHNWDGV